MKTVDYTPKIRPCPNCGTQAMIETRKWTTNCDRRFRVVCRAQDAVGAWRSSEPAAVTNWHTAPPRFIPDQRRLKKGFTPPAGPAVPTTPKIQIPGTAALPMVSGYAPLYDRWAKASQAYALAKLELDLIAADIGAFVRANPD